MTDPAYVARLFQIESGGDPNATTGSNRGLGQFGPQEESRYGISDQNRTDPAAQILAVQREAAEHAAVLQKALGRAPTPGELYLTHQQGVAGGPALLSADAGIPAWQAIRRFYGSDAIAKKAITGNVPGGSALAGRSADDITAGDFRSLWTNKFERGLGNAPTQMAAAPAAPGSSQSAPFSMAPGDASATAEAPAISPETLQALQGIATRANQPTMPAPAPLTIQYPNPPGLQRARALAAAMAQRPIA